MKRLSQILFVVVVGFFLFQLGAPTGYFVHFKMNQESIAKENCENIAKPELKCNGKCHLAKQLVEISNPTPIESPAKSPNFERAQELVWICFDQVEIQVPNKHISEYISDHWTSAYHFKYEQRIEHPPQIISSIS